ncbi:MAG: DUF4091 domain-containing protein [Victivallales bacterium]|nr:DUF4091 domain-containing protein [Victivallales bacterium]
MKRLLSVFMMIGLLCHGQLVKNASFEQGGKDLADGWTLSAQPGGVSEEGAVAGKRAAYVVGNGNDSVYWLSDTVPFEPGKTYRVRFKARSVGNAGGTAITGPVFCNVDMGTPKDLWTTYGHVFVVPENGQGESGRIRLGQWHGTGRFEFDDVAVMPVVPIYHEEQGMQLGYDEKILVNEYRFESQYSNEGRNHSRSLVSTNASFNTHRWLFGKGTEVTYRHAIAGRKQLSGRLETTVNYYVGGKLTMEASRDGKEWVVVGTQEDKGTLKAELPASMYPADEIYIRMKAESKEKVGAKDSDPGSFQVNAYRYFASLSGTPTEIAGDTRYIEVLSEDKSLNVRVLDIGDGLPGGKNNVKVEIENVGQNAVKLYPRVTIARPNAEADGHIYQSNGKVIQPKEKQSLVLPYYMIGTGEWRLTMALGGDSSYKIGSDLFVSDFYNTDYGELLTKPNWHGTVWWTSSGWKIPAGRGLPTKKGTALTISAAQGESEAAQLVIRPAVDITKVNVVVSDLNGPDGAVIAAECIDLLRVYYHDVQIKTDSTGILGLWPDALPPLKPDLSIKAGMNQPIWVRVNVPKDAKAGKYNGSINIRAKGWTATVPMQVEVFGFQLPDKMTCQTAFGFDAGALWRYHKPANGAQRRQLWDKYLKVYSQHHISPYNPTQLDNWSCALEGVENSWGAAPMEKVSQTEGGQSMYLKDNKKSANISYGYNKKFDIEKGEMKLHLEYKTNPGNTFTICFSHFDEFGDWMRGRNRDFHVKGDGSWQTFDVTFDSYPQGAVKFDVRIYATLYSDSGDRTGEVWVDQFKLTNDTTGKTLIDSDFKPLEEKELKLVFNWDRWDAAMEKAFNEYHFNTIKMNVTGLGSGTFHSRNEPRFMGYAEGTPQYEKLIKEYFGEIEAHLKAKGWLDKAYIYWFDEPDPKDYEFVMNGFRKLKKYAPGIRRMLTEQIEDDLIGGPNLWCPVTPRLKKEQVPERKALGEQFWWYVCTGPKAPYATLFIDHPGTELRVWLWQTWDYQVDGILVWASDYWSSPCAYPDSLQNPYKDPMSWVSGYDTPAGVRTPWGNGDGRFVYPPEAAADGKQNGTVMDDPVVSIRFEMLRDGIEDYEYFAMLKRLLAAKGANLPEAKRAEYEALLTVPENVTRTMTDFTKDPATYEAHRLKLAAAITELSK